MTINFYHTVASAILFSSVIIGWAALLAHLNAALLPPLLALA